MEPKEPTLFEGGDFDSNLGTTIRPLVRLGILAPSASANRCKCTCTQENSTENWMQYSEKEKQETPEIERQPTTAKNK